MFARGITNPCFEIATLFSVRRGGRPWISLSVRFPSRVVRSDLHELDCSIHCELSAQFSPSLGWFLSQCQGVSSDKLSTYSGRGTAHASVSPTRSPRTDGLFARVDVDVVFSSIGCEGALLEDCRCRDHRVSGT